MSSAVVAPPDYGWMGLGSNLGAMTDEEVDDLAFRLAEVTFAGDAADIFRVIPSAADRARVAQAALSLGGNPSVIQWGHDQANRESGFRSEMKSARKYGTIWGLVSTASMAASAYHGYKRNEKVRWALWWGFMGALFPVITPAIGLAQGFGKRKA
jgi:hypothetical protein